MANDRDNEDVVEGTAVELEPYDAPVARPEGTSTAIVARGEISVNDLVEQHEKITQAMEIAMQDGHHYGVIPGTKKPTLLKPGAEKLCVLFRLAPSYQSEKIWHEGNHLTVVSSCTLTHIPTGLSIATGEGLCSTKEGRYAQRSGGRVCPACGSDAIIKGREEYGGGFVCFKKKGGCGAKYDDHDPAITSQSDGGKVEVDSAELPNVWNTVLKMADKRALVAAILNGTAASDVFTQDMEDAPPAAAPEPPREFDPGIDLLPGAPARSRDRMKQLAAMMQYVSPTVDWPQLGGVLRTELYGDPDVSALSKAAFNDFANRICNAVTKVYDTMTGDFPPAEDEQIQEALAWAFEGILIPTIPHLEPVPEQEGGDGDEADPTEADSDAVSGGDSE